MKNKSVNSLRDAIAYAAMREEYSYKERKKLRENLRVSFSQAILNNSRQAVE